MTVAASKVLGKPLGEITSRMWTILNDYATTADGARLHHDVEGCSWSHTARGMPFDLLVGTIEAHQGACEWAIDD